MNHGEHNLDPDAPPIRRPASREEAGRAHRRRPDPQARQAWEEEQRLTTLLHLLPHQPLPEDFTRRVLAALDNDIRPASHWQEWLTISPPWKSWVPRLAGAAMVLALLATVWTRQQAATSRAELAASVASITRPVHQASQVAQLPPIELLRDFEAIDQMRQLSSLADQELLVALEQAEP